MEHQYDTIGDMDLSSGRSKEIKSESSSHEKNKSTPTSLSELCEQLRERITLKSQHYSISHEDQQALVSLKKILDQNS